MVNYHTADGVLEVRHRHEVIRIEAWGADSRIPVFTREGAEVLDVVR